MGDTEEVDALPVLADEPTVLRSGPSGQGLAPERRAPGAGVPAVQAAAVAAGGFVAGAAVVGLVGRRRRRHELTKLTRGRRAGRRLGKGGRDTGKAGELLQIVGSRSLLVDVHLLGGAGDR